MKIWIKKNQKNIMMILFILLGIGFIITRFWKLNILPYGMHLDEAGMAYDAWCLANYGVDRWLISWPVYLFNYGAGQSCLYAFLCAGLFKMFGYSIWLVRLPGVIFSGLTLIYGMKLAKEIFESNKIFILMTGALITFCPYFIMQSRLGLDCNLMLGASTVFLYYFIMAIKNGRICDYIIAGISGGIVLYTYALSYLIMPIFLVFSLIYTIITKKFSFKKWFIMAVAMGVVALPIILVQIVNIFGWPEMKLGPLTIPVLPAYRASEIETFKFKYFVETLKCIFVGDKYLFDSIPGVYNLYIISIPLFMVGFIDFVTGFFNSVKKVRYAAETYILFWFVSIVYFESHIIPYTYRLNAVFAVTALIIVNGVLVIKRIASHKYPIVLAVICVAYALMTIKFGAFYFIKYTDATFPLHYFGVTYEEAVEKIENSDTLRNKLTFVSERGIYYALSSKIAPDKFGLSGDECVHWNNYWFGSLQEITDECNYIVSGNYDEYCEELRQAGFTEEVYDRYALYYKE